MHFQVRKRKRFCSPKAIDRNSQFQSKLERWRMARKLGVSRTTQPLRNPNRHSSQEAQKSQVPTSIPSTVARAKEVVKRCRLMRQKVSRQGRRKEKKGRDRHSNHEDRKSSKLHNFNYNAVLQSLSTSASTIWYLQSEAWCYPEMDFYARTDV